MAANRSKIPLQKPKIEKVILFLRNLCYGARWSKGLGLQPVRRFRDSALLLVILAQAGTLNFGDAWWMPAFRGDDRRSRLLASKGRSELFDGSASRRVEPDFEIGKA